MAEMSRERPARPPPPTRTTDERMANIKNLHDESFLYIQQGLSCDEYGQYEQAVTLYKKGLDAIDQAVEIIKQTEHCSGPEWEKARLKVRKMEKSRGEITSRVQDILASDSATARAMQDPPPSYENATSPTTDADMSLGDSIMSQDLTDSRRSSLNAVDGTELFVIPDGVQIFFITPEGYVSAPSYPSALGVYKLDPASQGASDVEMPPAFLRIGDWSYPLLPGKSPMLRSDLGAYIFPDTSSDVVGSAVGVIIPNTVSDGERTILEDIFANFTAAHTEQEVLAAIENLPAIPEGIAERRPTAEESMEIDEASREEQKDRTATKISKGLVVAAEWLAWGLEKGAEKTGVLLNKGSKALQKQIKPDEEQKKVDPTTQKGIYYARQATSGAVKVSAFIVDGVGKATMALARQLAPHVRKQGEKLLPESVTKKGGGGASKVDDALEVAAGGLQGFGTVYLALEGAAKSLAKSLADETVSVVQHKYGKDVGNATENALYATGNLGLTVNNARNLGVKALAKRTAKDTGKAVLEDYKKKRVEAKGAGEGGPEKKDPSAGSRQPPPTGGAGAAGPSRGLYPTQQLPSQ